MTKLNYLEQLVFDGHVELSDTPQEWHCHHAWVQYGDGYFDTEVDEGHKVITGKDLWISVETKIIIYDLVTGKKVNAAENANPIYRVAGDGSNRRQYIHCKTYEQFLQCCMEKFEICDGGQSNFYSEEDWQSILKKEKEEQERQHRHNMESLCCEIMSKYNINYVDSIEFFEKVDELANDEEMDAQFRIDGLREDGLCIGFGATVEQWCDEMSHAKHAAYSTCEKWLELRDYLNETFPIMAAKYRQSKLQEA